MDKLNDTDFNERWLLNHAWEFYADIVFPEFNYRKELRALRAKCQEGTREEADLVYNKLAGREASLKTQFLGFIHEGYFNAFGCDIGANPIPSESSKIHNSFFDDRVGSFIVDWDENWIEVHGRRFIGIEVAPNFARLKAEFPDRFEEQTRSCVERSGTSPPTRIPSTVENHPQKRGPKNLETLRQEVIAECDRRYGDFFSWSNNKQIVYANQIAKELFPNKFDGRGLGQTAYLDSRKIYLSKQRSKLS